MYIRSQIQHWVASDTDVVGGLREQIDKWQSHGVWG